MLVLRDIVKRYGVLTALDGLSLELTRGEVFGLLGPNGAGKTTAISVAVGLIEPDGGDVHLLDESGAPIGSPTQAEVRAHMGICPQGNALYDRMSARENLMFFAQMQAVPRSERRPRVDALLERVGLTDRADDMVGGYSGGMRRRLNLAAALVHEPHLVLLDEPTAGVDPHSRSAIFDIVESLKQDGVTVVYTTHSMDEAQRLCDRVAIIDAGKVLAVDTVDALIDEHGGHATVTVVRDAGESRTETPDALKTLGEIDLHEPGVRAVRVDRPDLESVFLTLTGRSLRD